MAKQAAKKQQMKKSSAAGNTSSTSSRGSAEHWRKTRSLTFITLAIWAVFSFVIHDFAPGIGDGFSYFMAGMGSQVSFAILVFWFALRQDAIDKEHGVSG